MKQSLRAVSSQAAAQPSQVSYLCLDHEFPYLRDLDAHFRSRGLDYAIKCAGAPVYACVPPFDGVILLGHLRVVVYYDLFTDPGYEVLVVQDNGQEV